MRCGDMGRIAQTLVDDSVEHSAPRTRWRHLKRPKQSETILRDQPNLSESRANLGLEDAAPWTADQRLSNLRRSE